MVQGAPALRLEMEDFVHRSHSTRLDARMIRSPMKLSPERAYLSPTTLAPSVAPSMDGRPLSFVMRRASAQ